MGQFNLINILKTYVFT